MCQRQGRHFGMAELQTAHIRDVALCGIYSLSLNCCLMSDLLTTLQFQFVAADNF